MDIKKVTGVYFSPAGSTKTVVETTVDELARLFKAECRYISLNTPSDRAQGISLPRMSWSYSAVRCMPVGCRTRFRRTLLAACTVRYTGGGARHLRRQSV